MYSLLYSHSNINVVVCLFFCLFFVSLFILLVYAVMCFIEESNCLVVKLFMVLCLIVFVLRQVQVLWNACKFEGSLLGSMDRTCSLFSSQDVLQMEKLDDATDYFIKVSTLFNASRRKSEAQSTPAWPRHQVICSVR
jgi:hypothetical protein